MVISQVMREAKRRVCNFFEKPSECSKFVDNPASVDVDCGKPMVTEVIDPNVSDYYQFSIPVVAQKSWWSIPNQSSICLGRS